MGQNKERENKHCVFPGTAVFYQMCVFLLNLKEMYTKGIFLNILPNFGIFYI